MNQWTRIGTRTVAAAVTMVTFIGHNPVSAIILPGKDSDNTFSSYSMGLYDGSLYLTTGDSLHRLNLTDTSAGFTSVITGLQSTLDHKPSFDGGMAINDHGTALLWMGYEGGVLQVDLTGSTATVVGDFNQDENPDNVFSAAGGPNNTFYTMWSNNADVFTRVFQYDAANDTATSLGDIAPHFSGGLAVGKDGTIFASTLLSNYPDAVADLSFWSYDPNDDTPTWTLLTQGQATGNAVLIVDERGDLYFNTSSGIGRIRSGEDAVENVYGDILDPLTFDPDKVGVRIEGLTYDPISDTLYFAQRGGDGQFFLQSLVIPEPGTAMLILLGAAAMAAGRRSRHKAWH